MSEATGSEVLKALQAAAKGLRWPSESDKPVKAFLWKQDGSASSKVDEAAVRAGAKVSADTTVRTVPVEEFFAPLVTEQGWWGEEERATAKRFQGLEDALKEHLTGTVAFRTEGAHSDQSLVDAYIAGRTDDGSIAGVSTQLVET